jgi:hypothetical protein
METQTTEMDAALLATLRLDGHAQEETPQLQTHVLRYALMVSTSAPLDAMMATQ